MQPTINEPMHLRPTVIVREVRPSGELTLCQFPFPTYLSESEGMHFALAKLLPEAHWHFAVVK